MQRACRVRSDRAGQPTTLIRVLVPASPPGEIEPSWAAICATNSAARRCGGGPATVPATPCKQALDDESPVPPAGLLFGPCNQASATRLMQRACWGLRGLQGRQARRSRGPGKPAPSVGCPSVIQRGPLVCVRWAACRHLLLAIASRAPLCIRQGRAQRRSLLGRGRATGEPLE